MIEMNADMKVRCAIYDFETETNIYPNRIIMGYGLMNEIANQYIPIKTFEELTEEQRLGVRGAFMGVPTIVDEHNPETLEVGYMIDFTGKYTLEVDQ